MKKNISYEKNRVDDTVSALLESLPDAVYLIDLKGFILNTNTLFAAQFGKHPQECIGINVYDLIMNVLQLPELAVYHREKCQEVLRTGKRVVFADEKDVRKVTISPVLIAEGEISRLLITIQNISEQKRIDKELQKERALKTALLDSIPCSAIIFDADLRIIVRNKYAEGLLFCSTDTARLRVTANDFFGSQDMGFLRKKFMETITSGIEYNKVIKVFPQGGTEPLWLLTNTSRIFIEGKPCAVSIGVDISNRKRIETELINNRNRLHQAMEAAHAGAWEWDLKTDEVIWSDEIWSLYGLERVDQKPTFQLWSDTIHPDDRESAIQSISRAARNETELSVEFRVLYSDGSVHWLMSRGKPLFDNNGSTTHYIGTIIDITERKKMELELIESKLRYSYALDAAQSGIWEWNVKTDELSWSEQVWGLYGLKVNSLPLNNQLCVDTIYPDDREMVSWIIRDAVSNGIAASLEYRTCHPDGSVHWLTSRGMPLHDAKGQVTRYIGTIIDITERKKIETELLERKKRMTFALEATNTGVWEWDVIADKVTWTDNVWKLYGLEPNSKPATHKLCESNIHPDDRDLVFEQVMAAASKEIEINIEYRVCYKDGSIHWLMCKGLPRYNADGQLKSYIGTVTDITSRKELLNQLLEGQTRLAQALDAARAGIWEWNLKTGANIWSEETWGLYGLEKACSTPSFDLWAETIHPDDREMAIQAVSSAADNESELYVEYRISNNTGSERWLLSRGRPIYDRYGCVERYIGTIIDITERKAIEEKLIRSQERLNFILENSHIGVWDWNLNDNTTARTLEHARIFGYETISQVWSLEKFLDHIIPEDRVGTKTFIKSAIEKKEKYAFECRIHSAKGDLRWIRVTGAFKHDKNSKSSHVLGIVQDITEQKLVQTALRESELQFRTIFDHSPIAIAIRDILDDKLFDVNDAWERILGYTKEEVIGRSLKELQLYIKNEDYETDVAMLNEQGKIINKASHFRKKNGEIVYVLYSEDQITLNDKECVLVMMMDMTLQEVQQVSIERLEQIVADRTHQLKEEVKRLNSFLHMISHEYRTPLAIIRGNLDLIELKNKHSNCVNQVEMTKIRRAIDRLVEVMEESMHENRLFTSMNVLPLKSFQLAPVIISQVHSFMAMWPDQAVHYSENLEECEIIGDPSQLKLAIFNLFDNARKYSSPDSPIELDCYLEGDNAVISITNYGKPIKKGEAEVLFEKYNRGSNSMNTGGAGLGLWMVKNIIEEHNGQVSLKGIASGVKATILLPLFHRAH